MGYKEEKSRRTVQHLIKRLHSRNTGGKQKKLRRFRSARYQCHCFRSMDTKPTLLVLYVPFVRRILSFGDSELAAGPAPGILGGTIDSHPTMRVPVDYLPY